jgi:hypothetical protein
MAEEMFDVVVLTTGFYMGTEEDWLASPPPRENFPISTDIWIGKLPYGIKSRQVLDACDSAGYNFSPIRQYSGRYSFCRRVAPQTSLFYEWDHDGLMRKLLFLSRLIHPTTIASESSARLIYEDGQLTTIVPGFVHGYGTRVWIVANEWRDWLSQSEAEQLRDSLPRYIADPPERVRRARGYIDHAFHAYYLDQRTASLVSSFESLLKVERHNATAQFKCRVPVLAKAVGLSVATDEAASFYDDRSVYVHGAPSKYTDVDDILIMRYNRFETVLRQTLLRASTDPDFCNLFSTDENVAHAFGSLG